MSDELRGISVLVTRPSHQADNLVKLIESHGGEALRFPALQIEENTNRDAVLATIGNIADYDIAIFISINAVNNGVQYLPAQGKRPLLAAIGPSTARALVEAGFRNDIKATRGFTSEALLREPAFKDVANKKIVIFRGSGGRALLGRELEERGAKVTYAEVYRRDRPEGLDPEIESRIAAGTVDLITATSAETLVNLFELAAESTVTSLKRTRLVTASDRVVKKAAALGFEQDALLADGPDDQALVDAILKWRAASNSDIATGTTMTEPSPHGQDAPTFDGEKPQITAVEDVSQPDSGDGQTTAGKRVVEPVEKPAPAVAATPARRGGGALSLLAILLSLAALAASGYLWWEQRQAGRALAEAQSATSNLLASTQQEIDSLGGRLDESLSRVSSLDAARGRLQSGIEDLRGGVEALTARVQGAEQSIDSISGVSTSARNTWIRAEVEYFLQVANSRLQMARDPDSALAALQAADDRLKSLGDPGLFRVRQELGGEIAALKAMPRPDMEGIAHTLNSLATRVEELPLNNASPDNYKDVAEAVRPEGASALDRATATFKGAFTSMFTIKRTDAEATPLLSSDEEIYLKRNLELQLQTARLALLRGEAANYIESLRTARNWVQTHFQTDAASVRSTIATLTELEKEDISPSAPDISGSLRLLRLATPSEAPAPVQPPAESVAPQAPTDNAAATDDEVAA